MQCEYASNACEMSSCALLETWARIAASEVQTYSVMEQVLKAFLHRHPKRGGSAGMPYTSQNYGAMQCEAA